MVNLITMFLTEPFMKWGLNLIGPIKPMSRSHGNKYILVTTNYATNYMDGGKNIKNQHGYSHNSIHLWIHSNQVRLPSHFG
jgi:hypothetical protein